MQLLYSVVPLPLNSAMLLVLLYGYRPARQHRTVAVYGDDVCVTAAHQFSGDTMQKLSPVSDF